MAKRIRFYWDACAWIAYINQEKEIQNKDGTVENRFEMCRRILDGAENGRIEIVTSAFTLAEVCKSPEVKTSPLDNLAGFFDRSFLLMVPVDMAIGRKAQSIQVSGLFNVKPPDAVHLASAQRASVTEFHTFDGGLLDLDNTLTGTDGKPLKICKPTEGTSLGPLFEE